MKSKTYKQCIKIILMFVALSSFSAYAATASTKIGISITVKASLQCDYNISSFDNIETKNNTHTSNCDLNETSLYEKVNEVAYVDHTENGMTQDKYRVVMTVQ